MQPDTKIDALQAPIALEHPLQRSVMLVFQVLVYPIMLAVRLLLVRKLYRHPQAYALSSATTYIVFANHQSMLDPLVICASLPIRSLTKLLPIRFFIANAYFTGPSGHILSALGGFPAHPHPTKAYGLHKARAVMANGQTVMIFPQGHRTRERSVKPGIAALAAEPTAELIPIRIDWQNRWRCHIALGQPFASSGESPEELMQHVYDLELTTE
jgi:1-acyl-sn-glycerol-3-phosphate acyltransferase